MARNPTEGRAHGRPCSQCEKIANPLRKGLCNACRNKATYHRDIELTRQRANERYHRDIEASRAQRRQAGTYLKARYGLTVEQYDEMLTAQGGVCAICGSDDPGAGRMRFYVDHDHSCCPGKKTCGKCIRGLLCARCNTGIGMFSDDLSKLAAAISYLMGG